MRAITSCQLQAKSHGKIEYLFNFVRVIALFGVANAQHFYRNVPPNFLPTQKHQTNCIAD